MGRWGGRELSYASDADAMFVMDDGGPGEGDRTKIAGAVITEMRKLLIRPSADPPLSIDADLRPEGKGGALIRSLAAYQNYYSRWSSTWELQALVRADALAGDAELGQALMAEIDGRRWPEDGLTDGQINEIRKLKARVEAERLPRGADPAKHTKLGPGGLADVEWTVQMLQLQHAHAVPGAALHPDHRRAAGRPRRRHRRPAGRRAPRGRLGVRQPGPQPDHAGPRSRLGLLPHRQPGAGGGRRTAGLRTGGVLAPAGRLPPRHPAGPRRGRPGLLGPASR